MFLMVTETTKNVIKNLIYFNNFTTSIYLFIFFNTQVQYFISSIISKSFKEESTTKYYLKLYYINVTEFSSCIPK